RAELSDRALSRLGQDPPGQRRRAALGQGSAADAEGRDDRFRGEAAPAPVEAARIRSRRDRQYVRAGDDQGRAESAAELRPATRRHRGAANLARAGGRRWLHVGARSEFSTPFRRVTRTAIGGSWTRRTPAWSRQHRLRFPLRRTYGQPGGRSATRARPGPAWAGLPRTPCC